MINFNKFNYSTIELYCTKNFSSDNQCEDVEELVCFQYSLNERHSHCRGDCNGNDRSPDILISSAERSSFQFVIQDSCACSLYHIYGDLFLLQA